MAEIQGTIGADNLEGTPDADRIEGLAGDDTLRGLGGDDTLDGGRDGDSLQGGDGDDLYLVDNARDVAFEVDSEGIDEVQARVSFALSRAVENLTLLGGAAIGGTGNALGNVIVGNAGDNLLLGGQGDDDLSGGGGSDQLFGGVGIDTLRGGLGDDVYTVEDAGDVVIETAGAGQDTVRSSVTYALGAGSSLETLILLGAAAIDGTGNELANEILGNSAANELFGEGGDDTLDGGASSDTMSGGSGDDVYLADESADVVVEAPDSGSDTVLASVTFLLPDDVEALNLLGVSAIDGTGNSGANIIAGNQAANTLSGLGGADTLEGAGGADTLDGGTGVDRMRGGRGSDIYFVDVLGDGVREDVGEGLDEVRSTAATYTLQTNVENLTLLGSAIVGTGNEQGNQIDGNDAANTLIGNGGNDILFGNAGNDNLSGGSDKDTLFGGLGNDTLRGTGSATDSDELQGGEGNDFYEVFSTMQLVVEQADNGIDTVQTTLNNSTLAANVEDAIVTGDGAFAIQGNSLDNIITTTRSSRLGTMSGGEGNDRLFGGNNNSQLSGDDGNDLLEGGSRIDDINGGAGDDTLFGDLARDSLSGGLGADLFVYHLIADTRGSLPDTVSDFELGSDLIDLSAIDANQPLFGNQDFEFIGTGNFTNAGQARVRQSGSDAILELNTVGSAGQGTAPEGRIVLSGIDAASLTEGDFIL